MDIASILGSIKGKVLDATHFELLKHAYELQVQNINQLKNNNEALRENNELLQQKVRELADQNSRLKEVVEQLRKRLDKMHTSTSDEELSEEAQAILDLFVRQDARGFYETQIVQGLPFSRSKVKSGIDELSNARLIHFSSVSRDYGMKYHLTEKARRILASKLK